MFLENTPLANLLAILPGILYLSFSFAALMVVNPSKFSLKKTLWIVLPFIILLFAANLTLYSFYPTSRTDIGYFITLFIPQATLCFIMGKKRGWFAITAILNAFLAVYMVTLVKSSFIYKFPHPVTEYIIYIIFLPTLLVFLKFFYIKLQDLIERSLPKMIYILLVLTLIICSEIFIYTLFSREENSNMFRLYVFGAGIISIYIISLASFYIIMNELDKTATAAADQNVLDANMNAVTEKLRIRQMKDEQLRVLRHDMKHLLISTASLIQNNKNEEALELINGYTNIIESTSDKLYCNEPIINSVIDYYVAVCKANNITLDLKVNNIEDGLHINSAEVSIFLSNLFDNAINAVKKLPEERRYISFKFINNDGRLALQLKNNFDGTLITDTNGLPTSRANGHGIGTRSVNNFVKRHKCMLNYETKDKIFIINIIFGK